MAREQERAELHRTIWQIANDLRGSVDGWDFKNYVLGMLFYHLSMRRNGALEIPTLTMPHVPTSRLNSDAR